jgi:hypothetical protein
LKTVYSCMTLLLIVVIVALGLLIDWSIGSEIYEAFEAFVGIAIDSVGVKIDKFESFSNFFRNFITILPAVLPTNYRRVSLTWKSEKSPPRLFIDIKPSILFIRTIIYDQHLLKCQFYFRFSTFGAGTPSSHGAPVQYLFTAKWDLY